MIRPKKKTDMFNDAKYLAIYAQIVRDTVVASVDWMLPTCELPPGGGQSDFEKVVQRHLKGTDRQIASGFLANLITTVQKSSPEDWLDYVVQLSDESGGSLDPVQAIH